MAGPNDLVDALKGAAGDGPDDGDLRCPTCGASSKKIEAAQGGDDSGAGPAGPPPALRPMQPKGAFGL